MQKYRYKEAKGSDTGMFKYIIYVCICIHSIFLSYESYSYRSTGLPMFSPHLPSFNLHYGKFIKNLSLWLHLGNSLDCWCHFLPQSTEQSSFRGFGFVFVRSFLWWIWSSSCWDCWISCITCISRFCLKPGFWQAISVVLWSKSKMKQWSTEAYQQNHNPSSSWGRTWGSWGSWSHGSLQIEVHAENWDALNFWRWSSFNWSNQQSTPLLECLHSPASNCTKLRFWQHCERPKISQAKEFDMFVMIFWRLRPSLQPLVRVLE